MRTLESVYLWSRGSYIVSVLEGKAIVDIVNLVKAVYMNISAFGNQNSGKWEIRIPLHGTHLICAGLIVFFLEKYWSKTAVSVVRK